MPSANFQGMDIQQVRQVSGETRERAQEINQLAQRLDQEAQAVEWMGSDADRFKTQDWPNALAEVKQLCDLLEQIAQTLEENADQQQSVTQDY